jgi:hypothetical protein
VPLGEVTTIVPWIVGAEATIACMGTPSPAGGIQLEPVEPVGDVETQYIELLGGDVPQVSDTAEKWVEVARLFATSWRVQIAIESSRISISLPEPARKAGLLPSAGTQAVFLDSATYLKYAKLRDGTSMSAESLSSKCRL